jgi:hypothetical protein
MRRERYLRGVAVLCAAASLAPLAAAGEATVCLVNQISHGALLPGTGTRWKVGEREVSPSEVLALQVDSASPRRPECGVLFTDGTFLVGRFPDYSAGQENAFESETFGSFKVAQERVALMYMNGSPGECPELEAAKGPGVLLRNGEFVAGEVLYVSTRFAGLRVEQRIRKFNLGLVYAVAVRAVAVPKEAPGPWQIRTLNGDLLAGEIAERGFRVQVLGEPRPMPLERVAAAWQPGRTLLSAAKVQEAAQARRFRNGEGQALQLYTQRLLPDGLWQRGPSNLMLPIPSGVKTLVFRAWREPGFYKGQIQIRFCAGQEIMKELTLEPGMWELEGALAVPVATAEVKVMLLPGRDEGYGDRIIWEVLSVAH